MKTQTYKWQAAIAFLFYFTSQPVFAEIRDGRMFDQGLQRTAPAETAHEELSRLAPLVGDWDVKLEIYQPELEPLRSTGAARITFMNRGHGLMERTRIADFDGQDHPMATLAFIAVDAQGAWSMSEGNSWNETISVYTGDFEGDHLVLDNAMRPGGAKSLLLIRRTLERDGDDTFSLRTETSSDFGKTWSVSAVRHYSRHAQNDDFFPVRSDTGIANPERPAGASEFDFLLGEFDASHWMPGPQGPRRWTSNATATYVLDGNAILEFDWHDNDPNLPDAATSILRIYNRSMRRWESLFLTNRSNVPLYFGGVREEDRIVLHPFAAQTASSPLFQWIFFDQQADAYRWKGLRSDDRGETWSPHWAIEFHRKGMAVPDPASAPPQEIKTRASDGVTVFGDHYRSGIPASPTVVLFHQAGGDARGEYSAIARRLVGDGFEVFAFDARGGGDRFGSTNRTVQALGGDVDGYCEAYPDLEAALEKVFQLGSGGPIFAVGSSYSAALVIRLAAEHGKLLAGVAAFSPAPGLMGDCAVENWLEAAKSTPLLVLRPQKEMEDERVAAQATLFEDQGIELFVAPDAAHGASMLNPERSKGDTGPTWERLQGFFASPGQGAGTD